MSSWLSTPSWGQQLLTPVQDNLLPVSDSAGGGQFYPSSRRLTQRVYLAAGLSAVLFLIFVSSPSTIPVGAVVALAIIFPGALAALAIYWARQDVAEYRRARVGGTWKQGVSVSPSGDVTIRLTGPVHSINVTFPAGAISRADGTQRWPAKCGVRHLALFAVGSDGRMGVTRIAQYDLIDTVESVAEAVNDAKASGRA